jgi:hypothetical protein
MMTCKQWTTDFCIGNAGSRWKLQLRSHQGWHHSLTAMQSHQCHRTCAARFSLPRHPVTVFSLLPFCSFVTLPIPSGHRSLLRLRQMHTRTNVTILVPLLSATSVTFPCAIPLLCTASNLMLPQLTFISEK